MLLKNSVFELCLVIKVWALCVYPVNSEFRRYRLYSKQNVLTINT